MSDSLNRADKLYHIGLDGSVSAKYAILPGDPGRVEKIAEFLDNPRFVTSNREYTTYVGTVNGENVLVTSTGIGGPSTAIAVEELYKIGVRNFIRVGTCGGMQEEVIGGDVVVATAAIRMEGTSREYAPIEYPAAADFEVTSALVKACAESGVIYHTGVVQSKDSFYGQHDPGRMPVGRTLADNWEAWIKCGCMASEMECAALFTVCNILRARSGAVLSVVWNQERAKKGLPNPESHNTQNAIKAAVLAIGIMIENERKGEYA